MFDQVLVRKTAFNVVQMPLHVDGTPTLIAGYPDSLEAFDFEEGALGYEFDEGQQTLTLSYFSGGERVGFVLDPWCDETLVLLHRASSKGYILVSVNGDEATSTHMCGADVIWGEMLALVHRLRHGARSRRPPERFLPDAMLIVLEHAYDPHGLPSEQGDRGARSMNVVLGQGHLQAMFDA